MLVFTRSFVFGVFCQYFHGRMPASTAFNIYARAVVRQRKIPFEITAEGDPFYGEFNTKILKESIEQMENHPEKNVMKTLEELEELANG